MLDPEWSDLRATARTVLERFRDIGVPVPPLSTDLLGDISTVPFSER